MCIRDSVYDALVKDDEATACWVELIKAHIRGTELLELACGSGEITIALAQEGYHVDASDLSAAMIEEAKKKDGSEQVSWSVMDMCDLHTDKSYDGILCLCDSFNYLLKDEQVRALFQGCLLYTSGYDSAPCRGMQSSPYRMLQHTHCSLHVSPHWHRCHNDKTCLLYTSQKKYI